MDRNDVDEFSRSCEQFKDSIVAMGGILSLQIQAVGMVATNQQRLSLGESVAYVDEAFNSIAEEIEGIVDQLD